MEQRVDRTEERQQYDIEELIPVAWASFKEY